MSGLPLTSWLLAAVAAAVAIALGVGAMRLVWRAHGIYLIRRAGPRRLRAAAHLIWRDPGAIEALDLAHGPGGAAIGARAAVPRSSKSTLTGSQPCVSVADARGRLWRVKWGDEVRAENFAVRLVWACGYFAEVTHFVASGRIEGAHDLQRAASCIGEDCTFSEARFELDDPAVRKFFEEHSWAWNDNPFVGTRELNGLKIVVMLLSNWDTKDRRDVARGSNTAIFEHRVSRLAPRSALSDHRLGRLDGPLGQQHRHARPMGSGRVRGADAGLRDRHAGRVRAVRLRRPANRRRRRWDHVLTT